MHMDHMWAHVGPWVPPCSFRQSITLQHRVPGNQVLRVYSGGREVVRTDSPGKDPIYKFAMPMTPGRRYLFVLEGDVGEPYGGFRGHRGLR
jgi:hypothetical protein